MIYFKTKSGNVHHQGYLLSAKVDKDALKSSTGAHTIAEVIGKQITIKIADYRGRAVLRITPHPPAKQTDSIAPAVQQNPNPDPAGDDPGW